MGRIGVNYGLLQIPTDDRIIDITLAVHDEFTTELSGVIT